MIYVGAVGMAAGIVFYFYLLIFISAVLKWLLWRIATYNKGVFAVVLLVVTIVLGFIKVAIDVVS